jgi:hypothetical protein
MYYAYILCKIYTKYGGWFLALDWKLNGGCGCV